MNRVQIILLAMTAAFLMNIIAGAMCNTSEPNQTDTIKVVNWITKNAIPIESIELNSATADLDKIAPVLKNKRIIGLGDGTHGTKDFFLLKHRIIEYAVKNLNCTAIAMELPIDIGAHINGFIRTGEGNIDEIIEDAWWWHQSEEIKNFFIRMKEYNKTLPDHKKISFYGFDCQTNGYNTFQIFEYLKKVDDQYEANISPILNYMVELYIDNYTIFTPYRIQRSDQYFQNLKDIIETNKDKYISKSSKEEYFLTKARINTFVGLVEMKKNNLLFPRSAARSETNAKNIQLLSEIGGEDSQLIVWAHNGHITSGSYIMQEIFQYKTTDGFYEVNTRAKETLEGYILQNFFGDKYINIGFEFYEGSFTAIEYQKGIKEFTVAAPESNTLPYMLNKPQISGNCYFIELNQNTMDKACLNYFNSEQFGHEVGAAYISRYIKMVPLKSYNAIIFVRKTSGSKMLK